MNKNIVLTALSLAILTACGEQANNNLPQFSQPSLDVSTSEDISLQMQISATDIDDDPLTYALANAATHGVVNIDTNTGELIYTPHPDFNGSDSFIVSAADDKGVSTQHISVDVTSVNDAPIIENDTLLVSGGEIKHGQIIATDLDSDTLSYAIEQAPQNGTMLIDEGTGALTYTVHQLATYQDNFVVSVTDSQGTKATKALQINTSIASNIDRAYYYYSSEQSHLKQAQQITDSLNDDQVKSHVYSALVSGYSLSGFTQQAQKLLTKESISDDNVRAYTLLHAAKTSIKLGDITLVKEYLSNAQTLYNKVIATKGIHTLDADFFIEMAQIYSAIDDQQGEAQTYSLLELLMNTLPQSTDSQRVYFGYSELVDNAVTKWQETQSETDRLFAKSLAERSLNLIANLGYNTSYYTDALYSSTTLVAYKSVIEQFYQLNEIELAKTALAKALALYGYVDYDPAYSVEADVYADNTKDEYVWAAPEFAALFISLYPNIESTSLTAIAHGSMWFDYVQGSIIASADEARMIAQVLASNTDQEALAYARSAKKDDDLRQYFTDIITYNSYNPGAAQRLIEQQRYSAAKLLLNEGLDLIQTEEYFSENGSSYSFVSGNQGCNRIISMYLTMDKFSPNNNYLDDAKATAQVCHDLIVKHYSTELLSDDGAVLSTHLENTQAVAETSYYLALLAMESQLTKLLDIADNNLLAAKQEDNIEGYINTITQLGRDLAEGGEFILSQAYYDKAMASIAVVEDSASAAAVGNTTRAFFYRNNASNYNILLKSLDAVQLTLDNAMELKSIAIDKISSLFNEVLAVIAEHSDIIKNEEYPNFAKLFISLGNLERAEQLSQDSALGDVEKATIQVSMAKYLATKDAFPSTLIASVDTDGDGMPNFFAPFATDDMILASGLVLDPDSDNDGVNDEVDAFPLEAAKH